MRDPNRLETAFYISYKFFSMSEYHDYRRHVSREFFFVHSCELDYYPAKLKKNEAFTCNLQTQKVAYHMKDAKQSRSKFSRLSFSRPTRPPEKIAPDELLTAFLPSRCSGWILCLCLCLCVSLCLHHIIWIDQGLSFLISP